MTTSTPVSQKQLTLLQQYSKKLQDQNEALLFQIKTMREQLSIQSRTTATTTINSVTSCSNCKNKQLQIINLNKNIKDIRDSYQNDIKKLKTLTPTQKIVYKEITNTAQTLQLQKYKKLYEEIKVKYQQSQKIQWSTIKVDGTAQLKQQQINTLKNQNKGLNSKIQMLERKLHTIQDQNRVLQEQLVSLKYAKSTSTPVITTQPLQVIRPSIITQTSTQLPTFRYISSPKKVTIENKAMNSPACGCSYLSPFSLFDHQHDHHHHHQHHVPSGGYRVSNNLNNLFSDDYYKDIVQERWRSLQHKIRVLEEQNGKLRNQIHL